MYESVQFYRQIVTPSHVATPRVTYTGPGDIVSGARAWWGLRAYSNASIGSNCVRLRRDSDSAESNFVTLASGALDVASVTTFKGAANLFVAKLYDQTGNGSDMVQATSANQPSFILNSLGALPTLQFLAATNQFLAVTIAGGSIPYSIASVAIRTGNFTAFNAILTTHLDLRGLWFRSVANQAYFQPGAAGTELTPAATDSVWHSFRGVGDVGSESLDVDGSQTSAAFAAALVPDSLSMGSDSASEALTGNIAENGLWLLAFTTQNIADIRTNQTAYWGF